MKLEELQDLQRKIENVKTEKSKLEGALEQIRASWKQDFNCTTEDEIVAKIKEVEALIKDLQTKFDTYVAEIQAILKTAEG